MYTEEPLCNTKIMTNYFDLSFITNNNTLNILEKCEPVIKDMSFFDMLVDDFIYFITCPLAISIIGVLSFTAALVALFVSCKAYKLQCKSDKDLQKIELNIKKMENNVQRISKTASELQNNVNKISFQTERFTAISKYPEREEFGKINNSYQPFIFFLFDYESPIITIIINSEKQHWLTYKTEVIKNNINIPITKTASGVTFYIIKIVSPAYLAGINRSLLRKYKYSPIKEGEYYGCRFDETKRTWILGQRLLIGKESEGFYEFYESGSEVKDESNYSANKIIGDRNKCLNSEYICIDKFLINQDGAFPSRSGCQFNLLKKNGKIFFTISDSPLKEIYIARIYIETQRKTFLFFENLRGHIKNENFIDNLGSRVLNKVDINDFPIKTMDEFSFLDNLHIKIPLENKDI